MHSEKKRFLKVSFNLDNIPKPVKPDSFGLFGLSDSLYSFGSFGSFSLSVILVVITLFSNLNAAYERGTSTCLLECYSEETAVLRDCPFGIPITPKCLAALNICREECTDIRILYKFK
ncbi:hypothetical protein ACTFIW_002995 [Dictyostelium discoideum]